MNGAQVKRTRFRRKLFDLDVGNAGEGLDRERLLPKPFQVFEEITRALGRRLFRLVLQPVP